MIINRWKLLILIAIAYWKRLMAFQHTINEKNEMIKISNKYFRYGAFAIGGIFLGWLFFHSPRKSNDTKQIVTENNRAAIWTCAMHPQIRMSEPGKCPICGMDLIPLNQNNVDMDSAAVHSQNQLQSSNVMINSIKGKS
jgi:Cu(I)/Ag(I) efflux system membrane fusion protein